MYMCRLFEQASFGDFLLNSEGFIAKISFFFKGNKVELRRFYRNAQIVNTKYSNISDQNLMLIKISCNRVVSGLCFTLKKVCLCILAKLKSLKKVVIQSTVKIVKI